jgi:TfoX/Sxy family transcriptional regulator of competence genes
MAYNERLAERIRGYFTRRKGVEEKRMFGGLCFMLNGHMCCGIEKDRLVVRVMPERYETLLNKPHARKMDFTGKPLTGFLFISPPGYRTAAGLAGWLDEAVECAKSKPPKKKKAKYSPLTIKTGDKHLPATPELDTARQRKFREALKEVNRRYGRALKKLAE